jgi:hypothetical protein
MPQTLYPCVRIPPKISIPSASIMPPLRLNQHRRTWPHKLLLTRSFWVATSIASSGFMVHPFRFTSRQSIRSDLDIKFLPSYRTTREITLVAKRLQLPQHLSPHQTHSKVETIAKDFSNKLVNFLAKVRANTTRNYLIQ